MGPLQDMTIIELAGMGPTPFCGMVLADLGARVIRVDRPGTVGRDAAWDLRGRNKQSIALDLKSAEGRDAFFDLIAIADGLIEGFRPGVTERLGIGPEACQSRNAALVYGRATGWGQTGPLALSAGHDINYIALTGALAMIGPKEGAPVPPLNLVGDYGGGAMFLALGLIAAIHQARRTGQGQIVDAAMTDGVNMLLTVFHGFLAAGELSPHRGDNRLDGGLPWYTTYLTADGAYMAVGALEDPFYAAFIAGLGYSAGALPDRGDRANWPALHQAFAARFLQRTATEWDMVFAGTDACVTRVLALNEAVAHPQNVARAATLEVAGIRHPRPAPRFSSVPDPQLTAPVAAGADTRTILTELGWNDGRISAALDMAAAVQAR